MMLRLRCKTREGTHVLQGLTDISTVRELKERIASMPGISGPTQVMVGYPPTKLDLSNQDVALRDLAIKSGKLFATKEYIEGLLLENCGHINKPGDTLIVEEDKSIPSAVTKQCVNDVAKAPGIVRRVVPADNSCLFTSVYYLVEGGIYDPACAPELRNLIANLVSSDPTSYSEAVLGKSNAEYCSWIRKNDTWGGAIEVAILSKFYQCEICVVDTQTVRIDRFGEDAGYSRRVFLIYDGIHYDPLQRQFLEPDMPPMTIFPISDDDALLQALELADDARKKRQFTDVNKFALRCMVCQKGLTGQSAARDHAKETGHTNFGEV